MAENGKQIKGSRNAENAFETPTMPRPSRLLQHQLSLRDNLRSGFICSGLALPLVEVRKHGLALLFHSPREHPNWTNGYENHESGNQEHDQNLSNVGEVQGSVGPCIARLHRIAEIAERYDGSPRDGEPSNRIVSRI